jgi:hypothetical protein
MKKTKFISQNNKMNSPHKKKYTLASHLSQRLNQSLQESIFFSSPRINSIFFSTALRCFNFFATAQPTSDQQSKSLLPTLTGQWNLTQTTKARTANTRLAQWGLTSFIESLWYYCKFVLVDNLVFQIPPLRQAWERYQQP